MPSASQKRLLGLGLATLILLAFALGLRLGMLVGRQEIDEGERLPPPKPHTQTAESSSQAPSPSRLWNAYWGAPGAWMKPREAAPGKHLSEKEQEQMETILALGYLDGMKEAAISGGVTHHDKSKAQAGVNLVVSAHAPCATLMDMNGETLHTWRRDFTDVWPDYDPHGDDILFRGNQYWRRVHLFDNGDLLAIFEFYGLLKLDRNSEVIWAKKGQFHHEVTVTDSGEIHVLTREQTKLPKLWKRGAILEDFVAVLDSEGEELKRVSLLKCIENSAYAHLLAFCEPPQALPPHGWDLFHTNAIEILDGTLSSASPAFAEGNALTSLHQLNTVAIVDLEAEEAVWALAGMWMWQHHPRLLPTGNLLVFDNLADEESSKILEIDPLTQEVAWIYQGSEEQPFRTTSCGSCQRLGNGNTLITESNEGRAFEVTPEGEIVWEYINPHRAGEDDQYIALLFDVSRIERSKVSWLDTP